MGDTKPVHDWLPALTDDVVNLRYYFHTYMYYRHPTAATINYSLYPQVRTTDKAMNNLYSILKQLEPGAFMLLDGQGSELACMYIAKVSLAYQGASKRGG